MINWQKFKDDFCGKCMHYFYIDGKKIYSEQVRLCQRDEGECKRLLNAVMKKAVEIKNE